MAGTVALGDIDQLCFFTFCRPARLCSVQSTLIAHMDKSNLIESIVCFLTIHYYFCYSQTRSTFVHYYTDKYHTYSLALVQWHYVSNEPMLMPLLKGRFNLKANIKSVYDIISQFDGPIC